uniref:sodium channel protein type 11 subunit alpha-like n=1 Tax=Myxine glutinosa TaxID=7769 RepID=UPI00358F6C5F
MSKTTHFQVPDVSEDPPGQSKAPNAHAMPPGQSKAPDAHAMPPGQSKASRLLGQPWVPGVFFRRFTPEFLVSSEVMDVDEESKIDVEPQHPLRFLENGRKLPKLYGDLPKKLVGEPLEDLDPFYRDHEKLNAFIVINEVKTIYRMNSDRALFLFDPFNPLRRIAIKLFTHLYPLWLFCTFFTFVIMCTIIINCGLMAIQSEYAIWEHIFTAIYTFELCIKVLARGFFIGKFTFLRDPWNWIDLLVVLITYATLIGGNLKRVQALRMFRVLRILKTIAIIPGLKVIVYTLIKSIKKLADVTILTLISISIFALVGQQLFMGHLKNKCVRCSPTNISNEDWNDCITNTSLIFTTNGFSKSFHCLYPFAFPNIFIVSCVWCAHL